MSLEPETFSIAAQIRSAAVSPSSGNGPMSQRLAFQVESLAQSALPITSVTPPSDQELSETLFDHRAQLKLAISRLSMHLGDAWRDSMFRQIDLLYSLEDWEEDSSFIVGSAFRSLLRFVVFSAPRKIPGLAIAPSGNPIASWANGDERIHIEFQSNDLANAVLAKVTERGPEAVSWRGPVTNIRSFVQGFGVATLLGW